MRPGLAFGHSSPTTFLCAFFGWAALVFASHARADTARVVQIKDYAVPPECPTRQAFADAVEGRLPRSVRDADRTFPTFAVVVSPGVGESSGRLSIAAPDGTETAREVVGDTCGEVISALALIAALAIDPGASVADAPGGIVSTGSRDSHEGASSNAEVARGSSDDTAGKPRASLPPEAEPEGPRSERYSSAPAVTEVDRGTSRRSSALSGWRFGIGIDASFSGGIAPRLVFGTPVAVEAMAPRGGVSPTIRARFERATSGPGEASAPSAAFTWTAGVAELCPNRWQVGGLGLEPCARFEGGVVTAEGAHVVPARQDTHAGIALGAVARAEWSVWAPFFADFELGFHSPLYRTAYFFLPDTPYYRSPAVAGFAGAGLGAHFP